MESSKTQQSRTEDVRKFTVADAKRFVQLKKEMGHTFDIDTVLEQESGFAAIHLASLGGDLNAVKLLIEHGSNFMMRSSPMSSLDKSSNRKDGETPLQLAIACGHLELVRMLYTMCISSKSGFVAYEGGSLLTSAIVSRQVSVLKFLLKPSSTSSALNEGITADFRLKPSEDYNKEDGATPLMVACATLHLPSVKVLLDAGADPLVIEYSSGMLNNSLTVLLTSPLSIEAANDTVSGSFTGTIILQLAKCLISSQSRGRACSLVNHITGKNTSPLHLSLILLNKATRASEKSPALKAEAESHRQIFLNICYLLMDLVDPSASGSSLFQRDQQGLPLHYASGLGCVDLVEKLVSKMSQYENFCIDILSSDGDDGHSALMIASERGAIDIVEFLLRNGANPEKALHGAIQSGNRRIVELLLAASSEKLNTLKHRDLRGNTVFHVAASLPDLAAACDLTTMLFCLWGSEVCPDPTLNTLLTSHNFDGTSPLHCAVAAGNIDLVKWFLCKKEVIKRASLDLMSKSNSLFLCACSQGKSEILSGVLDTVLHQESISPFDVANSPGGKGAKGVTPLHYACKEGFFEICKLLIEKCGVNVNALEEESQLSPLFVAVSSVSSPPVVNERGFGERLRIVRFLLENGADPLLKAADGSIPLHAAISVGECEICRLLVESILKFGKGISFPNSTGATPLHIAASRGSKEVVALLLAAGADPMVRDNSGRTPFGAAIRNASAEDVFELILSHVRCTPISGSSLQTSTLTEHRLSAEGEILKQEALKQPSIISAEDVFEVISNSSQSESILSLLISGKVGGEKNSPLISPFAISSIDGRTMLHTAAIHNNVNAADAILRCASKFSNDRLVPSLLNVTDATSKGWTALSYAVHLRNVEMIQFLLGFVGTGQLDLFNSDSRGNTSLHVASVSDHEGDVIGMLLESAASLSSSYPGRLISLQNRNFETPLFLACSAGNLCALRLFLRKNLTSVEPFSLTHIQRESSCTPLHAACALGSFEMANLILNQNCDTCITKNLTLKVSCDFLNRFVNHQDKRGATALHYAASNSVSDNKQLVQLLLLCGADINAVDISGSTSLLLAAFNGNEEIAECLIENGADQSLLEKLANKMTS